MATTPNWPTLKGRLTYPLTNTLEALEQLEKSIPLSVYGRTTLMRERKKLLRNSTTLPASLDKLAGSKSHSTNR